MRLQMRETPCALIVRLRGGMNLHAYELPSGRTWAALYTTSGAIVRVLVPMRC